MRLTVCSPSVSTTATSATASIVGCLLLRSTSTLTVSLADERAATVTNTRTCPACCPPSLLPRAPTATTWPSAETATADPALLLAASPSMSAFTRCQAARPAYQRYTRACPALSQPPSLAVAPITTVLPSAERASDAEELSNMASPSRSPPCCTQAAVPLSQANTRTWPAP